MAQDVTALLSRYRLSGAGNGSASASKTRSKDLEQRYGIDVATYEQLHRSQGGVCAICHGDEVALDSSGRRQPLSVDHDHATGRVRGLLCTSCNHMLGKAKDDPNLLRAGAVYLDHGGTAGPQHQPRKR